MFEPKVMVCGVYNCVHCGGNGRCQISKIAISKDGKCSQMVLTKKTLPDTRDDDPDKEFYPYTNVC